MPVTQYTAITYSRETGLSVQVARDRLNAMVERGEATKRKVRKEARTGGMGTSVRFATTENVYTLKEPRA